MRITHEQIDEIVDAFAECQIDENSPTLKFNVESLQENFNAQINPLLEKTFELGELDAESLALLKHLLLIDEYQIHSADDMEFFFNIFGDTIGLFGIKKRDENFKILRLCFTVPDNSREAKTLDFVFWAFAKIFLPDVDSVEFIKALQSNKSVTRGGVIFSLTKNGNLNTVTAVAE